MSEHPHHVGKPGNDRDNWQLPDMAGLDLVFSFAQSVLEEFVLSHEPSDVLRELVQNEFDAGGTKLEVHFAEDAVTIRGNGKPIDSAGWNRLSVMLGGGRVAGSERIITPKMNGIGSKNFGIRSLFLLGDQIFIRSGGKQTVLDLLNGAPVKPVAEATSHGRRGVEIRVPYRMKTQGRLRPFSHDREEQALDSFTRNISPSLIKLAQPGAERSLNQVIVMSQRCGTELLWKQSAKKVPCQLPGVTAVRRLIHVGETGSRVTGEVGRRALEDLEFQKNLVLPVDYRDLPIPGYFKVPGGRIRLGVSVRVRNGKINTQEPGLFYYPLGTINDHTGTAISISAPFQLNPDRSHILDPGTSPLNRWLLQQAAELTVGLLVSDWLGRFGAEVFLALQKQREPRVPIYADELLSRLKSAAYWPTRAHTKKRPEFREASKVVVADSEELVGFLSDERYLPAAFSVNRKLFAFATACGVPTFTVNSLVRLRCCGEDRTALTTKMQKGEADYFYTEFPQPLCEQERQERFASALDFFSRKLSHQNRQDLKRSATTLTGDGTLGAPDTPLWHVSPTVASACPIPAALRLHPSLVSFKLVRSLCEPFKTSQWVRDVALRIQRGSATTDERIALYQHILAAHGRFDRGTGKLVRKTPALLDHRGHWVTPEHITLRRTPGASELEATLHFPHPDYAADSGIATALRFRKRIVSGDLLAFARVVQEHPEHAEALERLLSRFHHLVTARVVTDLAGIAFIRTSLGRLGKPKDTYVKNSVNLACLDEDFPFAVGRVSRLYVELGCLTKPRSGDVVARLARLRARGAPPDRPDILYPTLVELLKSEKIPVDSYGDVPLVWVDNGYVAPIDMLVGSRHRRQFLRAIPLVEGSTVFGQAVVALGAHYQPQARHWRQLMVWISERYGDTGTAVTKPVLQALRQAFAALESIPAGMPEDVKFLPDRHGTLYSLSQARSGRYVIDDEPQLSRLIANNGTAVAFADTEFVGTLRFYTAAGIQTLTQIRRHAGVDVGQELPSHRLNADAIMATLHSHEFCSALASLSAYELRNRPDYSRLNPGEIPQALRARKRVTFVSHLSVIYEVAGATWPVGEHLVTQADRFVCCNVRSIPELRGLLCQAVATLLVTDPSTQRAFTDAIYRLVDCGSTRDMARYLASRGVPWSPSAMSDIDQLDDNADEHAIQNTEEQVREILKEVFAQVSATSDLARAQSGASMQPPAQIEAYEKTTTPPLPTLPAIGLVTPRSVGLTSSAPKRREAGGGGRRSWAWSPPTARDQERDRLNGQRGEEIVYRSELNRVTALGYPPERVVWTSDRDQGADHDILSVADDGGDLWIEVKSTTGRDGRFRWSKREFDKALVARSRYVLVRVYEVNTLTPTLKLFPNPIELLVSHQMELGIDSLHAEVEALAPHQP